MNEEEKRKYEAFQYWVKTNTERGVTTIPDNLCLFIVNLIKSLQKENEELKNDYENLNNSVVVKNYYIKNSIPIQKIKDIIDRIDYDIKKTKEIISKNTNIYASYRKNDYQIVRLRAMNTKSLDIKKRLQEQLENYLRRYKN